MNDSLFPFIVLKSDLRWNACIAELRSLVESVRTASVGLDTEFWECPQLRAAASKPAAPSSAS